MAGNGYLSRSKESLLTVPTMVFSGRNFILCMSFISHKQPYCPIIVRLTARHYFQASRFKRQLSHHGLLTFGSRTRATHKGRIDTLLPLDFATHPVCEYKHQALSSTLQAPFHHDPVYLSPKLSMLCLCSPSFTPPPPPHAAIETKEPLPPRATMTYSYF